MTGLFLHPNSKEEVIDSYEEDIILTNQAGIIVKASHISGRQYDIPAEELLGQSVYDLEKKGIFSPAITPLVLQQKKKVVVIQTTTTGQKVLITGMPFFNEAGDVEYVLSYSYEVSELLVIQAYMKELEQEMLLAKDELSLLRKEKLEIDGLTIENRSTRVAYETARNAAPLDVSIVVTGEQGTGKSTMAKVIHKESGRKNGPFIEIDFETMPEAMFERELFGSEFDQTETGLLTLAHGGTLYLNGVDKLPLHLQGKLTQILKERKYTPLGTEISLPLDVQVDQLFRNHIGRGGFRKGISSRFVLSTQHCSDSFTTTSGPERRCTCADFHVFGAIFSGLSNGEEAIRRCLFSLMPARLAWESR